MGWSQVMWYWPFLLREVLEVKLVWRNGEVHLEVWQTSWELLQVLASNHPYYLGKVYSSFQTFLDVVPFKKLEFPVPCLQESSSLKRNVCSRMKTKLCPGPGGAPGELWLFFKNCSPPFLRSAIMAINPSYNLEATTLYAYFFNLVCKIYKQEGP